MNRVIKKIYRNGGYYIVFFYLNYILLKMEKAKINLFFDMARSVAMQSNSYKCHLGCVAIYRGKVIVSGYNSEKTHPMQMKYNKYRKNKIFKDGFLPTLHSEMKMLIELKKYDINFKKVKVFVYRIRKDQDFGMARPCPACMKAIKDFGIKKIYYTTNDGFACEYIEKE